MATPCGALTLKGKPCTRNAGPSGRCAWHDPNRVAPMGRTGYRIDPNAPRVCIQCKRELSAKHFYSSGHGNGRRRTCTFCLSEQAKTTSGYTRHKRYNARGEVWCNNCKTYQHADNFKRHPQRPHTFWTYCKPCVREIDRMRYRAKAKTPAGKESIRRRVERKRAQSHREMTERKAFIAKAIELLGRRGFTVSEIAKLAGVGLTNVYKWRAMKHRPTPAVEARFAIVLRETGHLPVGPERAFRRRSPHPELASLLERLAPQIAPHEVRSGWKNGARARA